MELAERISTEVSRNKDAIASLTRELVRIPSFSGDAEGLSAMAQVISEEMKKAGLSVELMEAEKGLTNVIGKCRGSDTAPWILFNGHTDVVPVPSEKDWVSPPFGAEIKDGRIYGRGACDMKGGLAAMLTVPKIIFSLFPEYKGNFILAATVDEEIGGFNGMKYVMEQRIKADMGIVCEPTDLKIVIVCKGLLWLKLRTGGRNAHGGMPEQGINAISKMSKVLGALENYDFQRTPHEILGKPSVNIGKISGGSRPNVVPDSCEAEIDIRYLPGQTYQQIINELNKLMHNLEKQDPQIDAEIELIRYRSPVEIPREETVVRTVGEALRRMLGREPEFRGMISAADSEYLVNAGIPSIMFGPGSDHLAHATNEWIAIDDILTAVKVYTATCLEIT